MRESLINRIIEFLRRHLLKKRWRRVATCMAAVVVFCTTYLLMLPAISMTKSAVSLSAEKLSAWSGDPLSVRVSAHTEEDEGRKIFVLVSKGAGAELSGTYVFDEDGVCVITDEEGREIELHRVFREKKKTAAEEDITADYWFSLEGGEQTAFTLQLSDEVDEERFLLAAEAVKSAAEQADAAADQGAETTATGSDADRKAEKQQEREQEKATGSDGQRAASAPLRAASVSDALKVEETDEEDGFAQLPDGEIVNDLPADEADETGEPTETVAFLEFSAGSGKVLSEAVKDAEKNADKRGDGRLKFTWKDIAESVFITPEMVWSGDGAHVAVIFDGDAMLPADAVLSVEEIEPGTDEYEAYLSQAVSVVRASGSDATKEMGVDYARFFDICILDGDGNELEPAAPVKVVITYDEAVSVEDGGDLNVMHFHEENTPEVLETEKNGILRDIPEERDGGSSAGAGLDVDALSFTAERFSVFGIVRTSIEKLILASDGQTYRVSVSCGTGAGVPAGAELSVSEITEDSSDYAEYVSKAESALGLEEGSASSVRLFDIKILSPDGEKVEISAPVNVEIRLADMEKGGGSRTADSDPGESTHVLHFADGAEQPEVLPDVAVADDAAAENSRVLSFAAEGFSVYAIVDAPEAFIPRKVSTLEELAAQMAEDAAAETETPFFFSYGTAPMYFTNSLNGNSSFIENAAVTEASAWYFEPVEGVENGYRIYTYVGASGAEEKKYIVNTSGNLAGLSGSSGTVFVLSRPAAGLFHFKMQNANKWLQHSGSGGGIRFWTDANNNVNSRITISYADSAIIPDDYYGLDGKTVGITYDSESIFCTALMSASPAAGSLAGQDMAKMDTKGYSDRLFVPLDSDLTEWTFHNVEGDKYYITTKVDGVDQYLTIRNGSAALSSTPQEGSLIQVSPGTGTYEGFYSFSSGGNRLTVNGEEGSRTFTGVSGGSTKSSWMKLAERSNLSEDDYLIYTAQKVGVSAPVEQVVLYTRVWNGAKYEFYVVDYDGSLIRCYDDGDVVKWVGNQYVTTVWELQEHTRTDDQGNEVPNGYYELINTYSHKYIKPQLENFSLFSGGDAYLSLDGRYYQEDYTKIKCWDDTYYSYMGLKADLESGKVVPCPSAQADDFYFAVVKSSSVHLTEVDTVVNDEYGITMKMVDFNYDIVNKRDSKQTEYFGYDSNSAGLLTTDIKGDGYPVVNHNSESLGTLFAGDPSSPDPRTRLHPVDRLFIQSVYDESGYFEYDSTQNYAHLIGDRFEVFDQLGTTERAGNQATSRHGQFMPFNSLIDPSTNEPWPYSEMYRNTTDVHGDPLSADNPRYGEGLHEIPASAADYFFGMEMSANFTQTKNGLDAWGHDIIFEFSGDDDFWLYVDNELVLDLGGVHKAMSGSVNFRTGVVTGRGGTTYTLRQVFESNFRARNPEASQADVDDFLNQYFEAGSTVFRDLSTHKMKVYYMERGAGASNLHMRFNLTAVKPGEVTLSKKVTGSEDIDYDLMEFPYQILYQTREDVEHDTWNRLVQNQSEPAVTYQGSKRPVKFASSFTPVDSTEAYPDVFFLKAGEIASIDMPGDAVNYKIVECGVNMHIFQTVKANNETLSQEGDDGRKSYETSSATIEERPEVGFENIVDPDSLRTLTISKILWDENGFTVVDEGTENEHKEGTRLNGYDDDDTGFSFRVYMSAQDSGALEPARNKNYYVRDLEADYCRWNAETQEFESLGIKDYGELAQYLAGLTDLERGAIVFETSGGGGLSRIPGGYSVEFRGLPVASSFEILERDDEIPAGYSLIEYERDKGSYISEEEPNQGTIRANEDPHVLVHNKRGWGLTVKKVWSDKDYMESRDDIYFAVYNHDDLLDGTVRSLALPSDSVYYYFDELPAGASFSDYEIYEVALTDPHTAADGTITYSAISRIEEGGTLTNGGKPIGEDYRDDLVYEVSYTRGSPSGGSSNVREDTVTNTRRGIRFVKQDWNGAALPGAVFSLKDSEGDPVGTGTYTSDSDGVITIAYMPPGTYTLEETMPPGGFQRPSPWTVTVEASNVSVMGDPGTYVVRQETVEEMASVTLKNKGFSLEVLKVDPDETGAGGALQGAVFSLYDQEYTVSGWVKDTNAMDGFKEISTGEDGKLTEITSALPAGTYYLSEVAPPDGYKQLPGDLVFVVNANGSVEIPQPFISADPPTLVIMNNLTDIDVTDWITNTVNEGHTTYTIRIPNEKAGVPVRIVKTDQSGDLLEGAAFTLSGGMLQEEIHSVSHRNTVVIGEETFEEALIYEHQALEAGEYTLQEDSVPTGYYLLEDPVTITVEKQGAGMIVAAKVNGQPSAFARAEMINVDHPEYGWRVTIMNSSGVTLPRTGGPGTRTITLFGALLTAAAGALLLLRRRARREY